MHNPEIPEIDPSSLYFADGTVNFDAVEAYLSTLRQDEQNELDEFGNASYHLSVPIDSLESKQDFDPHEFFEGLGPVERAVFLYIGRQAVKSLEMSSIPVSEALQLDPRYKPTLKPELERYFAYVSSTQPIRMGAIQENLTQLGEPKQDASTLRCVVAIPVAGHQEYDNIYHSLVQFSNQSMQPELYEIVLYVNIPGGANRHGPDIARLSKDSSKTIQEIERFKKEHPHITVRHFVNTYYGDLPGIGAIRSDLWDVVSYDLLNRGRSDDILVVSADADILHLSRDYLSEMHRQFTETEADVVAARLKWQQVPGLPFDAVANKVLRYQTFLDDTRNRNRNYFYHTADANTGISLATYLAIGGYRRDIDIGEMNTLVGYIRYLRQSDRDAEQYVPSRTVEALAWRSVLKTHSRRVVAAMALGHSPYDAWDQDLIQFGAHDELRTEQMNAALAEEQARKHWKEWLQEMTPGYVEDIDPERAERLVQSARRIIGFTDL